MNLDIKKIRLDELEDLVNSALFREFETIPISPARVKSYLNNPHAKPDDIVLYLGFIHNKLVAFRSLFADNVNCRNEKIRFAWCSGNWVHPHYRRNGYSEQLLKEAYSDWNQKLMFTNYAPSSESLYLKSGWFKPIHKFEGIKAYLFPKTRKLKKSSYRNVFLRAFYYGIDLLITLASLFRIRFFKYLIPSEIKFETVDFPDEECYTAIQMKSSRGIFDRGKKELQWIYNYPWISLTDNTLNKKYPFSSYSKSFYYQTVKIFKNTIFIGFFIFSVREGHLKTLYFCLPDGYTKEVADYLKNYCVTNKIELVTVYKKEVANRLHERKFPFLYVKKYGQRIYSTFEIKNHKKLEFQDGDGDLFFT